MLGVLGPEFPVTPVCSAYASSAVLDAVKRDRTGEPAGSVHSEGAPTATIGAPARRPHIGFVRSKLVDLPGGSRRYRTATHDLDTDRHLDLPWVVGPPGVVLVLDGLFLHRDELHDLWELSVFLDVPFDVTAARMAARDGSNPDRHHPSMCRYVDAQRTYFKSCTPAKRADLVIDNSDWDRPALQADR